MKRNTICRICAALLGIVMTLGFAGCVKTPSDVPDTTTTSAPVAVTTEGDSSPVEPADYENYQFKVLERELASGTSIYYEAFTDTESTDIINTALVKRNRLVEDRNKIKIVSTVIPNTSMKSAISTMVSSGDDLYDVIFGYGGYTMYFAINNYVRDMNTFEDITLDCEDMDAYRVADGLLVNCNGLIYAPEFPVLQPGENVVSWSGGIDHVEIIPRWWTL